MGTFRKISSLGRLQISLPENTTDASQPEEMPALMNLSLVMTRITKHRGFGKEDQGQLGPREILRPDLYKARWVGLLLPQTSRVKGVLYVNAGM